MTVSTPARFSAIAAAIALTAGALAGCAPAAPKATTPTVTDVWIKAVPDTAMMDMTGMFATFSNSSSDVIYITGGVASDTTLTDAKLDAHEVVKDAAGKMVMQEVKTGIPIPAHGSVILKPGGYHIMFWKLKKPIVAGDKVAVTVQFSNGTSLNVEADARDISNYAG